MRKIINSPDHVVSEMMEGYISAYGRYYEKHPNVNGVILKQRRKDKVALVIGGGSGHEPMFSGFVGKGLADAAACGNIFASPDPNTVPHGRMRTSWWKRCTDRLWKMRTFPPAMKCAYW